VPPPGRSLYRPRLGVSVFQTSSAPGIELESELGRNVDTSRESPVDGAIRGVHVVCPTSRLFVLLSREQPIENMDPANHSDPVFFFDFTRHGRREATLTR
jgi:hypothetical protein